MGQIQPLSGAWGANVIPFIRPPTDTARLSWRDRMDIAAWPQATHGLHRLVIHERSSLDAPDCESFLSVYRGAERWACWSLARRGSWVVAWCSTTGIDLGRFATMAEALRSVLAG